MPDALHSATICRHSAADLFARAAIEHLRVGGIQAAIRWSDAFAEWILFSSNPSAVDVELVKVASGSGSRSVLVVEKPRDIEDTHPFLPSDLAREVLRALNERFRPEDLPKMLPMRGGKPVFGTFEVEAVVSAEGWKRANSHFHYFMKKPPTHRYSQEAVDTLVERITRDHDYVTKSRKSLAAARRRKKAAP